MKNIIASALVLFTSAQAFAFTTVCGVNKPNGEEIRLSIEVTQKDAFSKPVIKTINGKAPTRVVNDVVGGFGYRGYENIKLKLTKKCEGSAEYDHYNAKMPYNPMEKLTLKCVCP